MQNDFIYLDHAATTPVSESVLSAMMPYFSEKFFNPSAPYFPALQVRREYEEAKNEIAKSIGAKSDELVMTAGATESINLAFSVLANFAEEGNEILIASFEHHSVLEAARKYGKIKFINVKRNGEIDLEDLKNKISSNTKLVSVMLANNETGVIQPITKITEIIKKEQSQRIAKGDFTPIFFHSDASQGIGQLDVSVGRLGVDMLTINAGKIYGPKQTGLLWASRNIELSPQIVGGGQERGLRSGTENVPSVIGFARAITIAQKHRKKEVARLKELKDIAVSILKNNFTDDELIFIGNHKKQLNSHLSISFPGVDVERIIFSLEAKGVLIATGSACAANKGTRSKTLLSMGLTDKEADGSLRISMGKLNNPENIHRAINILAEEVNKEMERIGLRSRK